MLASPALCWGSAEESCRKDARVLEAPLSTLLTWQAPYHPC